MKKKSLHKILQLAFRWRGFREIQDSPVFGRAITSPFSFYKRGNRRIPRSS